MLFFWLVCHCFRVLCAYAAFRVGSRLFCQCCCDCLFKQGVVLVLGVCCHVVVFG